MKTEQFFKKIKTYTSLSKEAESAWQNLLVEKSYRKGDNFVSIGQTPKTLLLLHVANCHKNEQAKKYDRHKK